MQNKGSSSRHLIKRAEKDYLFRQLNIDFFDAAIIDKVLESMLFGK